MTKTLASLLSSALILLSPGLACYDAVAADFNAPAGASRVDVRVPAGPTKTPGSLGVNLGVTAIPTDVGVNAGAGVETDLSLPNAAAVTPETAKLDVTAGLATPQASFARPDARQAVLPKSDSKAASPALSAVSEGVAATLQKADLAHASAGTARDAGEDVQDLMTGARVANVSGDGLAAPQASFGELETGVSYANPAGWDSIRPSAEQFSGTASNRQPPASPTANNDGGGSTGSNGAPKVPLIPRLISAGAALLPAIFLGWPLLAGGSVIAGTLLILGSLSAAALPFMSDSTPKLVRAVPGALIGALGLRTLAALSGGFAWPVAVMGALAALGGWGFVRFARKGGDGKRYVDATETIATFFGAVAAVAGAGLVLLHPAGLVAAGLTWVAYAGSTVLLMQLPSWVGAGIRAVFYGAYQTVRDSLKVMAAIHRDTSILTRLGNYTEAAVAKDSWNALWLGLLVWLPIVAVEGVRLLAGAAVGLAQAAGRAPLNLLWGIFHNLTAGRAQRAWQQALDASGGWNNPEAAKRADAARKQVLDSATLTKFIAGWAGFAYHNSKANLFNRFEDPLLPYANSDRFLARAAGALGLSFLQIGWAAYSLAMIPGSWLGGVVAGVKAASAPYDEKKANPESADLGRDDAPPPPDVQKPTVTTTAPGRMMAAAIALVPLYFLGTPLAMTVSVLGGLAALTLGAVALMPVMPKSARLPGFLRALPGSLMFLSGALAAAGGLYFGFYGLPAGWIVANGAAALLSGIGLKNLVAKLQDPKTKAWKTSDGWYIGGFASALFVAAGLGASLLGLPGLVFAGVRIAALVASPILLYHLPDSFWAGVGTAAKGLFDAPRKVHDVLGAWHRETRFESNLGSWYRYWVGKPGGFWYAPAFIVPLALQGIAHAAEFAVSAAVGLALGALRAPTMWLWGAAYKKWPNSRLTRLLAGYNKTSIGLLEGSKSVFDKGAAGLKAAMNDKDAVSSRPTLKAAGAFGLLRLLQGAWLLPLAAVAAVPAYLLSAWFAGLPFAAFLAGLGALLGAAYALASLYGGLRNAWGPKKPAEQGKPDGDDPRSALGDIRIFGWRW